MLKTSVWLKASMSELHKKMEESLLKRPDNMSSPELCSDKGLAAAGDLPNEKVNFCRKCKANGYPHEAISFRTIGDGRLKTDGSREFKTFQIVNYDNDSPHEHRQKQRGAA